ncbi:MAG: hypothetical protein AABY27_04260, partial [Pseudomonadota bacterium]
MARNSYFVFAQPVQNVYNDASTTGNAIGNATLLQDDRTSSIAGLTSQNNGDTLLELYLISEEQKAMESNTSNHTNYKYTQTDKTVIFTKEQLLALSNIGVEDDVIIADKIELSELCDITIFTSKNIIFRENASITLKNMSIARFGAGIGDLECRGSECNATVILENHKHPQIFAEGGGKVYIYYNPAPKIDEETYTHKYHNPNSYTRNVGSKSSTAYMLVNDINDLQDITKFLHGNYALSRDIEANKTISWDNGNGFAPLISNKMPFSGH